MISYKANNFPQQPVLFDSFIHSFTHSLIHQSFIRDSQVVLVVKNLRANAGGIRDSGLILGSGRYLGERNGKLFWYSYLENPWTEEPGGLCPWGRSVRHD